MGAVFLNYRRGDSEGQAALKRNIPVIPVLVQGARMPVSEQLPEDLQDLPYRNGFELGHTTWESDVAEMVKRLGLQEQRPAASIPTPAEHGAPPGQRSAILRTTWLPWTAAAAVIIGSAGLILYFNPQQAATGTIALPESSTGGVPQTSAGQAAPATSARGVEASGLDFKWPGGDCWDIYRGAQPVTNHCGSNRQALEAGTYTIKPKHAPVFGAFEIKVVDGAQIKAP